MSEKISRFIVNVLIDGKKVNINQRNLYEYCFNTIIEIAINVISAIIIGIVCHKLIEVFIFMAIFFPLRTFCGGFHCETSSGCYIMSMIFLIVAIIVFPFLQSLSQTFWIISAIVNYMIVLLLSPVGGVHKKIFDNDKKRMKTTALIITAFIYILELFLYRSGNAYFYLIALTALLSLISMVIGKMMLKTYHSGRFLDRSE